MGKRANLATVQMSSVVPAQGYQAMPLRTGYESVVASRLGKDFAFNAKQDGEVVKVTDRFISVKYKDGTKDGIALGKYHGPMAGKFVSHDMLTDFTNGSKFKQGDVIAWNGGYFERDLFSKTNVTMKTGIIATVALLESNDTLEDGSAISERASKLLRTSISKRRTLLVTFDQEVKNLVKVGDELDYSSVLGTIVDTGIGNADYDDAAIAALSKLSNTSPKSKLTGKAANIEIAYLGEKEDMSPGLRELADEHDKRRGQLANATGARMSKTCQAKESVFFGGEKLLPNTMAITIYIDTESNSGVGDKTVVCNQLKTIHGRVMFGRNETEDGRPIDVIFGWGSVNNRIVGSPLITGSINTTLAKAMEIMVELYEK